jgi:hypothetical protein
MTNWLTHEMAKITVHLPVGRVPLQIPKVNLKFRELYSPHKTLAPTMPGPPYFRGFTITLRYTSFGKNPLDE